MIKIFAMDVDGTLTDGKINISDNGEIYKSFSVKDGYGIKKAMEYGIVPVILTGRESKIVENRALELGITEIHQNISNKLERLKQICSKYNVNLENTAYIGDDENDLECLNFSKLSFAPFDAVEKVKKCVDIVTNNSGGNGAVREAIEYILREENEKDNY